MLYEIKKEDTSPSLKSVRFPNVASGNLVWLIMCTKQRTICIGAFPNALTSKKVINHEISIYFSINAIIALYHEPP